ncbi:MAG: hypothetical protein RL150_255 [Candidatus Parcubacteria bacterium]|jgi:hypothetical protein
MNKKTNVASGLFMLGALMLTLGSANFAEASTYEFINSSNQRTSVVANSSAEALRTAYNLGVHSGVMLVRGDTSIAGGQVSMGQGAHVYEFINTSGQRTSVMANSLAEALRTAYNLGVHSGVMLVQ